MIKKINPMQIAISEAEKAGKCGEIPVGAVIFDAKQEKIIAAAGNMVEKDKNPLAHAEILVITEACKKLKRKTLDDLDIYVTLEPCSLCASAISMVRLRRLYFGAYDIKSGGVFHGAKVFQSSSCHYSPDVYSGIEENKCSMILKDFFKQMRELKK